MEGQRKTMEVIIDGKMYTLVGDESEEYMQKIASYVNSKIQELKGMQSYSKLNKEYQGILLALNISDDLYKAKGILKDMEAKDGKKEKEIYERNQELLTEKMQTEASRKLLDEYKNKIDELQKRIMELETGVK